jgi:hypothetical protein
MCKPVEAAGVGVFGSWNHLVLPNAQMFDGDDLPRALAVLFARSLGSSTNVTTWDLFHYWEGQVMGSPAGRSYASGAVSFLILGFEIFGTPIGTQTLAWAEKIGWPVAWSEPLPSDGHQWAHNALGAINRRVLDVHGLNVVKRSATVAEVTKFDKLWSVVGATASPSDAQRSAWWSALEGALGADKRFRSLRAGRCGAAEERCIGLSVDGDCVCKK